MPISYRASGKKKRGAGMTTAEYLRTPETVLPRELAYGVLRVADSPTTPHQRVVRDLTIALTLFTRERALGEVIPAPMDVILDYDAALVVQPDILFVAREREGIVRERVFGAPDLVIEVLSPHPRIGRLEERIGWFAEHGVKECWLVDLAKRQVSVLTLGAPGVVKQEPAGAYDVIPSAILEGSRFTMAAIAGWN